MGQTEFLRIQLTAKSSEFHAIPGTALQCAKKVVVAFREISHETTIPRTAL